MIETVKYNAVFDHIDIMIRSIYENSTRYANSVVLLGFNQMQPMEEIRRQHPGKRIIIYQLERLFDGSDWVKSKHLLMLSQADEVWEYDQSNLQWLWEKHRIRAYFRPLVYTDSLKTLNISQNPDIDVLFYGYMHERRAKSLYHMQLKVSGALKLFNVYGVWGEQLDDLIARSKIVINIHGDSGMMQEQARLFYPVINGKCIVSETSAYNYFGNAIIQVPFTGMVDTCIQLVKNGSWNDVAMNASARYKLVSEKHLEYWYR